MTSDDAWIIIAIAERDRMACPRRVKTDPVSTALYRRLEHRQLTRVFVAELLRHRPLAHRRWSPYRPSTAAMDGVMNYWTISVSNGSRAIVVPICPSVRSAPRMTDAMVKAKTGPKRLSSRRCSPSTG